jgi:hypothetical protein
LTASEELSGVVLSRDSTGERFFRVRMFDQTSGLRAVLFSSPGKRSSKHPPPDLFDDIICLTNPKQSDQSIPFARDFERVHSYRELTVQPAHFLTAGEIACFYLSNGSHLLDPAPQLALLRTSLGSLMRASFPKVVLLKLYFCFARNEGLPVRESWLSGLPVDSREDAREVLQRPVKEVGVEKERIQDLLHSLQIWMNTETELQV